MNHVAVGVAPADYSRAILNILEDAHAERQRSVATHRAVLNILGDAADDSQRARDAQRAMHNVLADVGSDKQHLELSQRALLNILDDVNDERRQRGEAEAEVRALNQGLEQRVSQRTEQLATANKDLEGFSYSVSHDLRAPLRAIDGFSSLLLEEYTARLDEEGQRLLQAVRRNAVKMARLIDDILAFSRAGRRDLEQTRIDMDALCREVLEEQAPPPGVVHVQSPLPAASGDRSMLRQVLVNLLSNAVKFSGKAASPRVAVRGVADATAVTYSIEDNGAGFDPAYVHKLFGVFQRLHGPDEFPGTGIGLAIVKRIVDKHGGRVWADARAGAGATFHFSLPLPTETPP